MTGLPREWERIPLHVRWPQPDVDRRYVDGDVVLVDGDELVMRSDTIADDVVDDLEKSAN
jgi:hypothetical protein